MAKWIFASKYPTNNDEEGPEVARFHEKCKGWHNPNNEVLITAELIESDDQEVCDWTVWDDGIVIAKGFEYSTEDEWAIDRAQRKAEKAIVTMTVTPQNAIAVRGNVHQMRPARPQRRAVTGQTENSEVSEEERINRVVNDWQNRTKRRQVA